MSRRSSKPASLAPIRVHCESLDHQGRGVAHVNGKVVFIDGALAGEDVSFVYRKQHKRYDEAHVVAVHSPAAQRVTPRCPHYGVCGGCSLQHLSTAGQVQAKQQMLLDTLKHVGQVEPERVLPALTGPVWGYRRRARLGVRYVIKKERVLVGFRERGLGLLAELERCEVLHPAIGERLMALRDLVGALQGRDHIAQIEVALGDDAAALVFRHLQPLAEPDLAALRAFGVETGLQIYLQPGGPATIHLLWPETAHLSYRLADESLELHFLPSDFVQVNGELNRAMVSQALALLAPTANDRVLDLFCGIGNFTLPIARHAGTVVGVEGDASLVQRARDNAARNHIGNATFYAVDLAHTTAHEAWPAPPYTQVLLDPPRTGALEVLPWLAQCGAQRLVYVSCNPATLARDAGELVRHYGFAFRSVGAMDMFAHTNHIEAMALFERV